MKRLLPAFAGLLLAVCLCSLQALAQTPLTVSGVVRNDNGQPMNGVSVTIKGTALGVTTDAKGAFTIQAPSRESVLVFSYVGFDPVEIRASQPNPTVTLSAADNRLNDIVVVGYGTQRKVSMTSAVSELSGKELVNRPVTSLSQALQGKLPGLTVLDNGGSPGSPNTNIVIRGTNTPYQPVGLGIAQTAQVGDNGPLVIVDGVEQPFANINPDDIESISVLKDASSTAIYGSRAANGVILITTKRARSGKVAVTYSGYYAWQNAVSQPEPMDIESYLRLQNRAYENVGSAPKYSEAQIQEYVKGSVENPLQYPLPYNWYNVMLRTAPQTNHTVGISGGNENFRGRMSVRYQDQDGIIANTNSKLSDIRVNTDFKASDRLNFSADVNYRYQKVTEPHDINSVFRFMMQNAIWEVPKYPNGTYGGGTQGNNPLLLAEAGGLNRVASDYVLGNLKGELKIARGLNLVTQIAGRSTSVFQKDFVNTWETRDSTVVKKRNLHNRLTEIRSSNRELTWNSMLNYNRDFGAHELKLLAGYSQIHNNGTFLSAYRQDFYNNDVQSLGQGANDATKDNGGGDTEWGLRSFFGRLNYAFENRYLFEANARYDGSSRFTGDNRYSFFPSFSAGWRLSQEKFWAGLRNTIGELKLRGSWGETGNQAVALYSYFPTLNLVGYTFNGLPVQGYLQRQLADPNLTWETTTQWDAGLDAALLNNHITVTADYYHKRTHGILLTLPVPATLGLEGGPQNAGVVENKGWEFTGGYRNRLGAFNLNANLNFSINQNEVVDLAGTGPYIYGNDIDPRYITGEGYPINAFWGYKTDGLYQSDEEAKNDPQFMRPAKAGDVRIVDLNGDGKITPDDMTFLANSFPKYSFGGIVNLTYKSFGLNLTLQGASDVGMRIARALGEQGNYEGFTPSIYAGNVWTPENPNARFPRPTKQDLRNQASTDRMIVDASYLRLKNIQVSYNLAPALLQRAHIDRMTVYVAGTNLVTFSKLNEWNLDPESSSGWQNYYPQVSLLTVGLNLGF